MPKLSVIIPVYNASRYLKTCVESVINQKYTDWELILIDDGSTDKSLEICNRFAHKDDRIRVFHIENHGSAYARNVGLDAATGDFIGFVDADDWIDTHMYSTLLEVAERENADIVSCGIILEGGNLKIGRRNDFRGGVYDRMRIVEEFFPKLICSKNLESELPYTMVLKVFSRKLIEGVGIRFEPSLRAGQDFVFATTAIYHSQKFVLLKDKFFYHYRQHQDSRTHRGIADPWEIYGRANDYWKELLSSSEEFDFRDQIALDRLHGILISLLYLFKPNSVPNLEKRKYARQLLDKEVDQSVFKLIDWKRIAAKKGFICLLLKMGLKDVCVDVLAMYSALNTTVARIRFGYKYKDIRATKNI